MLGIKDKVEWKTVWKFLKKFNKSYHMTQQFYSYSICKRNYMKLKKCVKTLVFK